MKKVFLSLIAVSLIALTAGAVTTGSWFIGAGGCSNLVSGPVKVTSVIYTSTNNNTGAFSFIDSPSTTLTNIVPAYSNMVSYATNTYWGYTNFFGATNYITNVVLVDVTNTVNASTNFFPTKFAGISATNSQTRVDNVSQLYLYGLTVTNTGAGMMNFQVNYLQ